MKELIINSESSGALAIASYIYKRAAMFGSSFCSGSQVPFTFSGAKTKSVQEDSLDFSQPWQFSDAVLVAEEKTFHVHRNILGMWSDVFTTMFTAQFKEKTAEEVALPGKKSAEIKEMLLVIYPTSSKPIDERNYAFLLDLAKEYMMTKLTEKCENYLISQLGPGPGQPLGGLGDGICYCGSSEKKGKCLKLLQIAQCYELNKLKEACIEKAKRTNFKELKNDLMYEKITLANYRRIVEGIVETLERDLSSKKSEIQTLRSASQNKTSVTLKKLENIICILASIVGKPHPASTIDARLDYISNSKGELKRLARPLRDLHNELA